MREDLYEMLFAVFGIALGAILKWSPIQAEKIGILLIILGSGALLVILGQFATKRLGALIRRPPSRTP